MKSNQRKNLKVGLRTLELLKSKRNDKLRTLEAVILEIIEENEKLKQENANLINILKNTK